MTAACMLTQLQQVFADNFKQLGGTITLQTSVTVGQTDMSSVLASVASGSPELIYFPIFMPEGAFIIDQAKTTPGLENTKLMVADGLYSPDVVNAAGASIEGLWFQPGCPGCCIRCICSQIQGQVWHLPINIFHAHAYDAFNIIKAAIEKVAVVEADGTIYIPRQGSARCRGSHQGFPRLDRCLDLQHWTVTAPTRSSVCTSIIPGNIRPR